MASSGLYLSLDKQFWPWDWAWVQSVQGSSQLGKTVKMITFMGLTAILYVHNLPWRGSSQHYSTL